METIITVDCIEYGLAITIVILYLLYFLFMPKVTKRLLAEEDDRLTQSLSRFTQHENNENSLVHLSEKQDTDNKRLYTVSIDKQRVIGTYRVP